ETDARRFAEPAVGRVIELRGRRPCSGLHARAKLPLPHAARERPAHEELRIAARHAPAAVRQWRKMVDGVELQATGGGWCQFLNSAIPNFQSIPNSRFPTPNSQ